MDIHKIDVAGYHTGESRVIGDDAPIPRGWREGTLPTLAPGEFAVWDGAVFRVTTTASPAAQLELEAERRGMVVERWAFANAAQLAGIITSAEAEAWGPGVSLPAAVDTALAAVLTDPSELSMAKVRALAAPRIGRTNSIVELLRAALSLTPEQADDVFRTAQQIERENT